MWIATLSRAVARPFSYVVCPVEVISIGPFSGVFIPCIKPALANKPASNKTSGRMAKTKGTAAKSPCKGKTALPREILLRSVVWRLAVCASFSFNCAVVPVDDDVTSQGEIGGNAYHRPAAFTTTHWSVVLEAQGESPAAQEALEKLCRIYWRPLYGFVRRQGVSPEDAQDLTQGFFTLLL